MLKTKHVLRLISSLAFCFAIFNGTMILKNSDFLSSSFASNSQNIITIFDGDNKQIINTDKKTVGDVVKELKIEIRPEDIIEPSLNYKINNDIFINIYRAMPITIVDNNQKIKVITPHKQPKYIIEHSEINFYDGDQAELKMDPLSLNQDMGVELKIKRAKVINFDYLGVKSKIRTQAKIVSQFLDSKSIKLSQNHKINLPENAKITDQMSLEVWQEGEQEKTVEEDIKFTVRKIYNYDQPYGYKKIKTKGENGKKAVTYKIYIKNKKEVSKEQIKSVVIKESVEQVIEIGMKINLPPGSHQDWMRSAGISESDFGYVEFIISHESGWGHTKWNYNGSGAYGLCQALPASKMKSAGADYMTNPITQLKWCNGYAVGRYGSWSKAYQFWTKNHWW